MIDIKLASDGTLGGSKLVVNGNEVSNLVSCSFSCWAGSEMPYFSYTTESLVDEDSNMVKMETYFLADEYKIKRMQDENYKYVGQANLDNKQYSLYSITKYENRK